MKSMKKNKNNSSSDSGLFSNEIDKNKGIIPLNCDVFKIKNDLYSDYKSFNNSFWGT